MSFPFHSNEYFIRVIKPLHLTPKIQALGITNSLIIYKPTTPSLGFHIFEDRNPDEGLRRRTQVKLQTLLYQRVIQTSAKWDGPKWTEPTSKRSTWYTKWSDYILSLTMLRLTSFLLFTYFHFILVLIQNLNKLTFFENKLAYSTFNY